MRRRTLHRNSLFALLMMVALALAGCNRSTVYHHYEPVPVDGWTRNDTLHFHVTPAKDDAVFHEEVELRIFWPPLAPVIIKESDLPRTLQQEEIPEDIYLAASNVIINYMIFLMPNQTPTENPFENS